MILIGGILGFIIITNAFKNIKGRLNKKDILCNVKIANKSISSIVDSGSFLRDPITKEPVIIIEQKKLEGIIPSYILENTINIINGKQEELGEYASKLRVIPFKSLGRDNGLLLGIKMDSIEIEYQDLSIRKSAIIGIYTGILNKSGRYSGIVGLEAIDE